MSLQRRWGKDKARSFLKTLAAQQPGVRDGHNITAQLLAAGEFHVVTNTYAHIAARIKAQGGPLQYVFDQPVITYVHPIALLKAAPHPNAGKLLVSFILSAEGQRMLREQGRIPSRREIDAQVFSLRNVALRQRSQARQGIRTRRRRDESDFQRHMIVADLTLERLTQLDRETVVR